jgi:protein-tyrosine phosphatase
LIDLHSHVLPGLDDGPASLDDAVALAEAAARAGTTVMVATPHVSAAWPGNTAPRILAAVEAFGAVLKKRGVDLQVLPGAEVSMTIATELSDAELGALTLGAGPWLLVDCSSASGDYEAALSMLAMRGQRLLIAHAERCVAFQRDPELVERLVNGGVLCSITASSFSGRFGRHARALAHDLLERGLAHNVASDAHGLPERSPEIESHVLDAGYSREVVAWLTRATPRAILRGDPIPTGPPIVNRRRSWRLRRRHGG